MHKRLTLFRSELRVSHVYDEVEAELNLVLDRLVDLISEQVCVCMRDSCHLKELNLLLVRLVDLIS